MFCITLEKNIILVSYDYDDRFWNAYNNDNMIENIINFLLNSVSFIDVNIKNETASYLDPIRESILNDIELYLIERINEIEGCSIVYEYDTLIQNIEIRKKRTPLIKICKTPEFDMNWIRFLDKKCHYIEIILHRPKHVSDRLKEMIVLYCEDSPQLKLENARRQIYAYIQEKTKNYIKLHTTCEKMQHDELYGIIDKAFHVYKSYEDVLIYILQNENIVRLTEPVKLKVKINSDEEVVYMLT